MKSSNLPGTESRVVTAIQTHCLMDANKLGSLRFLPGGSVRVFSSGSRVSMCISV